VRTYLITAILTGAVVLARYTVVSDMVLVVTEDYLGIERQSSCRTGGDGGLNTNFSKGKART